MTGQDSVPDRQISDPDRQISVHRGGVRGGRGAIVATGTPTCEAVAWTIVIPTFGRPAAVAAAVAACRSLDAPVGGFEIVVVDDGGGDIDDSVAGGDGVAVRLIRQSNRGPAAARNRGAAVAHGRCLAFLDDDCRPEPGWLCVLDEALSDRADLLVGGLTHNALVDNVFSAASQDLVDALYRCANGAHDGARFLTSNNLGLRADSFRSFGGFDERYRLAGGEDRAFCRLWRRSGRQLAHAPHAVVHHHHALDLWSFCRQHMRYGRGARYVYADATEGDLRARGPVAAARLALDAIRQPLRSPHDGRRLQRAAALVLAQFATVAGRFDEACRRRSARA